MNNQVLSTSGSTMYSFPIPPPSVKDAKKALKDAQRCERASRRRQKAAERKRRAKEDARDLAIRTLRDVAENGCDKGARIAAAERLLAWSKEN